MNAQHGASGFVIIARVVAAVALVCFLACVALMGRKIADSNKAADKRTWVFSAIDTRSFTFAGHDVRLTDFDRARQAYVKLQYAGQEVDLRVTIPGQYELPGLQKHADWLKVLRFADTTGIPELNLPGRIASGEVPERLVVVTRVPRQGVDPQTWGQVYKSDWSFDLLELRPDGTIAREHLTYPMSEMRRERLGIKGPTENELKEGTWQYNAALHLMPRQGPTYQFQTSPVMGTGWTLPAAALSGMVMLAALVASLSVRPRSVAW